MSAVNPSEHFAQAASAHTEAPVIPQNINPYDTAGGEPGSSGDKKHRWPIIGGAVAVVAGIAGVVGLATGGKGSSEVVSADDAAPVTADADPNTTVAKPDEVVVTTVPRVAETPSSVANPTKESFIFGSLEHPEVVNPDFEPQLLTGEEPEEVAARLLYGLAALENVNDREAELEIIHSLAGNSAASQRAISFLQERAQLTREYMQPIRDHMQKYNQEYPFIQYGMDNVSAEYPDDHTMVLRLSLVRDYNPVNHPENNVVFDKEYTLKWSDTMTEKISTDGTAQKIWVLRGVA